MKGRIFLIRDLTYCALFDYPQEPISIIGEVREEITPSGIRRTPVVIAYRDEPIVCPYCMFHHSINDSDNIIFPDCDPRRRRGIVKDEHGTSYDPKKDGFYIQYR